MRVHAYNATRSALKAALVRGTEHVGQPRAPLLEWPVDAETSPGDNAPPAADRCPVVPSVIVWGYALPRRHFRVWDAVVHHSYQTRSERCVRTPQYSDTQAQRPATYRVGLAEPVFLADQSSPLVLTLEE